MFLPYAPFGKDYLMYRFQNRCLELPDLDYPDRLMYIYFNTSGTTSSYWEGESTAGSADALAQACGPLRKHLCV